MKEPGINPRLYLYEMSSTLIIEWYVNGKSVG